LKFIPIYNIIYHTIIPAASPKARVKSPNPTSKTKTIKFTIITGKKMRKMINMGINAIHDLGEENK